MQAKRAGGNRIGIITGSGPEAGLDLWSKLLRASRALQGGRFRGDLDAPNVTIFSEPALGLSMELERHHAEVWACLESAARDIARRVDHYAIACNTLNVYQPQLEALQLPARLVSFADAALEFIRANGFGRVALLGAQPVLDLGPWSHYRRLAEQVALEVPGAAQAGDLHRLIHDVKTRGADAPGLAARFAAILETLEADTVLLACTELPLIAVEPGARRLVDVTQLVADKLARLALPDS
jgi:aspartate racemase